MAKIQEENKRVRIWNLLAFGAVFSFFGGSIIYSLRVLFTNFQALPALETLEVLDYHPFNKMPYVQNIFLNVSLLIVLPGLLS